MYQPQPITALLVALFTTVAQGHVRYICMSTVPDNPDECGTATLWLMTYTHGAVGQIPGIAAVSIGSNPHPNSPFSFSNVCENVGNPTPSTTYALQGLMRSPNGFRSTSRCGQSVQDMNVLSPGLELVCFSSLTGPQGERVVQQAGTYGAPYCYPYSTTIGRAAPVKLTNINAQQDINIAIWNTDVVVAPSGTGMESMCGVTRSSTLNYPSMTQFNPPSNIGAFGTSQLNEIRFKIPAGSINIPGCGNSCPAYVPPASSNAESHDCNDASVAPGTPCNVQCPAGRTRVGTEVVCVGGSGSAPGSYSGQISCSENAVCPSGCSGGSCPGLSTLINGPVTQISGMGCGALTEEDTSCSFSCDPQTIQFAQGNIECDSTGNWVKSDDARCVPCENGGCQAQPDGCPTSLPQSVVLPSNTDGSKDHTVCVSGFNFDPSNDKVILVQGADTVCGSASAEALGGLILDCNLGAASQCGSNDQHMLACGPFPDELLQSVQTTGFKICVCDSDVQGGCNELSSRYATSGPCFAAVAPKAIAQPTQSPTQSPTQAPTDAPTDSPTDSPTQSPTTSAPTESPTQSPTTSAPTESPTLSPTTSAPTESPTAQPTAAPTASPTMPCSTFTQTFEVTETRMACEESTDGESASAGGSSRRIRRGNGNGNNGNGNGNGESSSDSGNGHGDKCGHDSNNGVARAFGAVWEAESHLFDETEYTLADVVRSGGIVATGEWESEAETRTLHVEVTYKPESPVDHVSWPAAATDLWERDGLMVSYCGCNYSIVIHESGSHYNQATEEDVKNNGGCYRAFRTGGESPGSSASASSSDGSSASASSSDGNSASAISSDGNSASADAEDTEASEEASTEEPAVPTTEASTAAANKNNRGSGSSRRGGGRVLRGVAY